MYEPNVHPYCKSRYKYFREHESKILRKLLLNSVKEDFKV
ncbi:hypothetical protein CLV99_3519 [Sphingobacterium yanglingense]|uniref:Uncharacterized protein n=1 Tax=Sphingobacterium yanglingense TaxID=1437280 RepID=A0A4R6W9H2_9SPHI|nr:hypothetical protein CLV99_3519 [Sphingobacterium yanglingense]